MALDISVHKSILLQILKDIYSDADISPYLGFKGGTAAYIFFDLDRFSVDLDFDLLDEAKEEQVFSRIEQIVKNYGQIKEARKKPLDKTGVFLYNCNIMASKEKLGNLCR